MSNIRQRRRALNSGILPLFAWADENERVHHRKATRMARHMSRQAGIAPATAIAICDALGLGGEAFND